MSDIKTIAIVGATGSQGGSVLNTFLTSTNFDIRAITRNTSSPKAQALQQKSDRITLVAADLQDQSSLEHAFSGAHMIFGVTDFWAVYGVQENRSLVSAGQTYPEWVQDQEIKQGKNIFRAAANTKTLERLVFSNLAGFKKLSGGKYSNVLHFDSKSIVVDWAKANLQGVWEKTSLVQLGVYLSNFLGTPFFSPVKVSFTP